MKKDLKITQHASKIRDLFNSSTIKKTKVYIKKRHGDWDQFCAALDTIEDTCFAIESFKLGATECFEKNPYLATYGILQTLYVQQDAVSFLKTSLLGSDNKIDWANTKYSELAKIRTIRNETIGHPVKTSRNGRGSKFVNNEVSSCTIDRSSLSKDGFGYLLWLNSGPESKTIKFAEIIEIQDRCLSSELKLVIQEFLREEKLHKDKFKGKKLLELLTKPTLYKIHLIYGVLWNDHLAWPSFDHYYDLYKKTRQGIEERYGKFGESLRIPGTKEVIKKLDFVFQKIESFKTTGQFDSRETEIYIDALESLIEELKVHLKEIDQEFAS